MMLEHLAARVGITQGHLSRIARNATVPTPQTLRRIADPFGCPWLSTADNAALLRAVAWRCLVIAGFHPQTPSDRTWDARVARALAAAEEAVRLPPSDAPALLRQWARTLPGVPGLAKVAWQDLTPFLVWVWLTAVHHRETAGQPMTARPVQGVPVYPALQFWAS